MLQLNMKKIWYSINNDFYHDLHHFGQREAVRIKVWDAVYFQLVYLKSNLFRELEERIG